ncbi:hypothetical protein HG535_0C01100 [Zygotorulaspora mrakii]|uniref:Uncharacterized protein n=1 Tax=Zygotorulaspora mrakii TaxID=42260 RepID=A0A7H9AZI3_ZYGMR|nr:uncharacterized protein HG535_0C01100 [Zygotorulaspora mrakii]QLG71761.1 hypothetical protein HG535_0C01100 [Zygotorulaspora mrakii]
MDLSSDNFEYIFQLTKVLSSECRANRQEREKLEILLKRLAKQSGVSYDQLSENVELQTLDAYNLMAQPDEATHLMTENYELLYQIELQEYINRKILALTSEIAEHLNSIRCFVIERKLTGSQNIDNYLEENITARKDRLHSNIESLRQSKRSTEEKLEIICQELTSQIHEIDWDSVPRNSEIYKSFKERIALLEVNYGLKVLDEQLKDSL